MTERWYLDERAALGAVRFFERLLTHPKGPLAGQAFLQEPWQQDILRQLFGMKDAATGRRRFRRAYLELPRGNGKSTWAAGLALMMLVADGEQAAEIFGAAAEREQAHLVFEIATAMVQDSPHLRKLVKIYKKSMVIESTRSVYKVLSAEAYSKHGLNPHAIIFDELHAQPNRELYDVLNTAMGKRSQPLMIMITTAGFDRQSICWQQHEYARQVAAGIIDDPTFLPVIYAADEADDWTSEAVWAKANPNWGISVQPETMRQELQVALSNPAYQNTFRRLYLNQWTQQETRWLDMQMWDACSARLPDLTGRVCYGGLDLASTTDIAAFVLVFGPKGDARALQQEYILWTMMAQAAANEKRPFLMAPPRRERVWLLPFFWIPADNLMERERRDRAPYAAWVQQGFIETTPGNVIDYSFIRARMNELAQMYEIREAAFDPWNATQVSIELQEDGFEMVLMRQGFASMSAPMKELARLTLGQGLGHGGNPVLRWMADNVTARQDAAGNIKPDKEKSTNKIDGIVAAIMGLGRLMAAAGPEGSMYDDPAVADV